MALTKEERYARHRKYQSTPEALEKRRAYDKARYSTPEHKEKIRKIRLTDEFKEKSRSRASAYRSKPEYKLWKKAYRNSQKAKDARRDQLLRKNFGITLADYAIMLASQEGLCAICRRTDTNRSLAVDHCHVTGRIRGLLCRFCNQALGILDDDHERLVRAAAYLRV